MKKLQKLFKKNLLFRYVTTFLCVIFIVSSLLILEKTIPNNRVKDNILKSEGYYQDYFEGVFGNLNNLKTRHNTVDITADIWHLSMLYFEDNKHPVKEFIEMNKDSQSAINMLHGGHFKDMKIDSDYSRYWHGHLIVLKPLLTFFTMNTIYKLYFCILVITFCILLVNIIKHSKLLAVIFTLGSVGINIFFTSHCDNFFHVTMITLLSSIIIIKMYEKKSKNVDLLFLINGILTACFDMLSTGTLPVTIPLFIYIYLHILDNKKIKYKTVLKYIVLWLLGGMFAYIVKWIMLVIHYNGGFREHVLGQMELRTGSGDQGRLTVFISTIYGVLQYIFPYDLQVLKLIIIGIGLLSFVYVLTNKNNKKNRNNYLYLLVICLIPFIRYYLLAQHSDYHNYYTYRAFLPNIMFILLFISLAFIEIKKELTKPVNKK